MFRLTREFIYGGRAMFSVTEGQDRLTFRISYKPPEGEYREAYFAYVQAGKKKWAYLGKISTPDKRFVDFWTTNATPKQGRDRDIEMLRLALRTINGQPLPESLTISHCGKCSVCGRTLKQKESVERGIGSSCYRNLVERTQ